jgi:metal-responsive CopG/Arc/MetJ family transcriptional regulator
MRTIQMTLDEDLVAEVDRAVADLNTSRSAFARDALRGALRQLQVREQEERQRRGYQRFPTQPGEFDGWEDEQSWGEP